MRKLMVVCTLVFLGVAPLCAQTAAPDSGPSWQRLQALPSGMGISVKAHKAPSTNCAFKNASETELVCASGNGALHTFQRGDLKSVRIHHRGRSTLVGLAIGAGAGAIVGAPFGRSHDIIGHGAAAAILAVPGAIIGAVVGASTDFTHSTVYKAH